MSADVLLSIVACALYAVGTVLAIAHARDPAVPRGQDILVVAGSALACLLGALAVRGLRLGVFPAFGPFEAAVWYAAATTAAYLHVGLRREVLRTLSAVLLPCLGAIVAAGLSRAGGPGRPADAVHGPIVGLHVTAAFAGYGLFTLEGLLAAAYVVQDRNLKRKRFGAVCRRLPSLEVLDRTMQELIGPAFALFTVSIGMGLVLTRLYGWGLRWATDPKVVLTGAAWLLYAGLLYLRGRADRHGRRIAYVALFALLLLLAAFAGVHLVAATMHDFGLGRP